MPAPAIIHQLVARFKKNSDDYYQIKQLVFHLYGLTEEVNSIIEEV